MVEAVILFGGALVLGGICKVCCSDKRYTEEYYRYLRNNKQTYSHDKRVEYWDKYL